MCNVLTGVEQYVTRGQGDVLDQRRQQLSVSRRQGTQQQVAVEHIGAGRQGANVHWLNHSSA